VIAAASSAERMVRAIAHTPLLVNSSPATYAAGPSTLRGCCEKDAVR